MNKLLPALCILVASITIGSPDHVIAQTEVQSVAKLGDEYIVYKVDTFKVRFYGNSKDAPENLRAWIYLYGKQNPTGVVGTIAFYPDALLATKSDRVDGLGRPQGNMASSELTSVLDMLRNGKDVYVHWSHLWKQTWLDSSDDKMTDDESKMLFAANSASSPAPLDAVLAVAVDKTLTIKCQFQLPGTVDQSFMNSEYRYSVLNQNGIQVKDGVMVRFPTRTISLPKKMRSIDDATDATIDASKLKSGEKYYFLVSVRNLTGLATFTAP